MKKQLIKEPREFMLTGLIVLVLSLVTTAQRPGLLDTSFGNGGLVLGPTNWGYARSMAIQADGKIVAAGVGAGITVVRYTSDGSLDLTFGNGGRVQTLPYYSLANSVAIQSDGKIVVGGTFNQDIAVVRYNSDGSLDQTFGNGGVVIDDISGGGIDDARAIAIQADGKIVAVGTWNWGKYGSGDVEVRYDANGSHDNSFGNGGVTWSSNYYRIDPSGVAIQTDGKIIMSAEGFVVVRLNINGSLDSTFGDGGIAWNSGYFSGGTNSVSIQPDGKAVLAGASGSYPNNFNFAIARCNTNGSLDTTFDGDGVVTTSIGPTATANSVAIEANGKIVVAGYSTSGSNYDFAIARYNSDGSLDTTFGDGNGKTTVDFNNSDDQAYGMALDSQGRAVVAGESEGRFAIARLILGTRRAPFDFDGDGRSDTSVFRPSDSIWYLNRSSESFYATQFGIATDKIVPADYDGDGVTDLAVYREGTWWILRSSNNTPESRAFGIASDVPVPADYTGDGRDELAVYRNGQWWMLESNDQSSLINFGLAGDKPVPADYDGDGEVDEAVYRNGEWHINRSNLGYTVINFGLVSDRPVVGDYDGDAKADVAVYRNGTWYLQQSTEGFASFQWGLSTDTPVPADYDGDGKTDATVFRNGVWYSRRSTAGILIQQFGLTGDKPIPSSYIH